MKVKLANGHELTLPNLKYGVMGRPGSGKSTLIASMAIESADAVISKLLVFASDPVEKLMPYFDRCSEVKQSTGQFGQSVFVGIGPRTGKPIMQIEQFYDAEKNNPQAMNAMMARADQLRGEIEAGMFDAFGFDSWTQFEKWAIYRRTTGPFAVKDAEAFGRARWPAAEDLYGILASRLMLLPCHVGIVFHVTAEQKEEGGVTFYGIKAIGNQLPIEIASLLPERYRAVAEADGSTRRLYTRPDGRFDLCTLIDAPSPCPNDFRALWSNWISKKSAMVADSKPSTQAAEAATAATVPQKEQ